MPNATILSLATALPDHTITQADLASEISGRLNLRSTASSLMTRIFNHSKIDRRNLAIDDFGSPATTTLYAQALADQVPGMSARNAIYKIEAPKLAQLAAERALDQWGGHRSEITHIVSVSCTGMIAPGLEFLLIKALGLLPTVDRLGVNFMGCFGAFKGLSVANALASQNPKNRVLVVCTELCSLHFQADAKPDTFVANALFADGAAAVIVGQEAGGLWEIIDHASLAIKDSTDLMTWEAGDTGYAMRLSAQVPTQVESKIKAFTSSLLNDRVCPTECDWAIHPGGKAIIEGVGQQCNLTPDQLQPSWEVLSQCGNMSSPTVLFVLDNILKTGQPKPWCASIGFGPGLSIEGALLKWAC